MPIEKGKTRSLKDTPSYYHTITHASSPFC